LLHPGGTTTPDCEAKRVGSIISEWRSSDVEQLRYRTNHSTLRGAPITCDRALHFRRGCLHHFNKQFSRDHQRESTRGGNCDRRLKIPLREEALNRNPIWALTPSDLRELRPDLEEALPERLAW
jgi:hypothetical protein